MAWTEKRTISLTTSAGGAATAYTPVINGTVKNVVYTVGSLGASTVLVIATETSGRTLLSKTVGNASANFPGLTGPTTDDAGTSDPSTRDGPVVCGERLSIAITSGGATATGSVTIEIEGTFSGA